MKLYPDRGGFNMFILKKNHNKKVTELSKEIVRLADEKLALNEQLATQKKEIDTLKEIKETEEIANQRDENEVSKEVVRLMAEVSQLEEQLALKETELSQLPVIEKTDDVLTTVDHDEQLTELIAENAKLKELNQSLESSLAEKKSAVNSAKTTAVPVPAELSPEEQADLAKVAIIKEMESHGFSYKGTALNTLSEEVAIGVKQRGDQLIVELFYLAKELQTHKDPQVSVRLQSSELYDYKVLRYGNKRVENVSYDVEVKTKIGNKKLTKYIAGYLEDIQTYREKGSGNGGILFEQVFKELALRSVPTLTGSLSVAQRPDFPWLKPYLAKLGFDLPKKDEVGKISREI